MITTEQAYEMGAKGATPTEAERLLFEAWMRGHCWSISGDWDGTTYVHESERNLRQVHPGAMNTRMLWAAWRDRAALENDRARDENDSVAIDRACFDRGCACFDPRIDKDAVIVEKRS